MEELSTERRVPAFLDVLWRLPVSAESNELANLTRDKCGEVTRPE
jgi:hypothetical protein